MKNKKKDDFNKIKLSIENIVIKEVTVDKICSDCLDTKDVKVYCNKQGRVVYDIKNKSKYNKKALKVLVDNNSGDYYFGYAGCKEALAKLGKSVSYEYMKDHNKNYIKLGFYSRKVFGKDSIFGSDGRDVWGIPKKEFDKFWSLNVRGYFRGLKKSRVICGEDRLKYLMGEGYVFEKGEDSYYVFHNTKDDEIFCRCCGEMKHNDNYTKGSTICKECVSEERKERYKNMTEEERDIIRERTREFKKTDKYKKYRNSPMVKFSDNIRKRVLVSFANGGWSKDTNTYKYIGLTFDEFVVHMEAQFTEGMTWDNWGIDGWHLDHRLPLAAGKNDKEKTKMLWHWTNLQPMWAEENIAKGNKHCPEQLEAFLEERKAESMV